MPVYLAYALAMVLIGKMLRKRAMLLHCDRSALATSRPLIVVIVLRCAFAMRIRKICATVLPCLVCHDCASVRPPPFAKFMQGVALPILGCAMFGVCLQ